jgi:hypothetical protein
MNWLVEPLAGIKLLDALFLAKACTGDAVLDHCSCIFGLKKCDCNGGLVVQTDETES